MAYRGFYTPKRPEKYLGDSRNIIYRSLWERRVMRYCDETPGVLKWASEEFCIPYVSPVDNRGHRYFPDFYMEVSVNNGGVKKYVIEVKPKQQAKAPRPRKTRKYLKEMATYAINQAKWTAARAYCTKQGWLFLVLTEDDLFGKKHAR